MENNKELFNKVFGDEITNVEFFGKKETGFNCFIYDENGDIFSSNSENIFFNLYDAFAFAYKEQYLKKKH